jgi:hypothetical protein
MGSELQFVGLEPACGITMQVAKKVVKDWTNQDHRQEWDSLSGYKQAK